MKKSQRNIKRIDVVSYGLAISITMFALEQPANWLVDLIADGQEHTLNRPPGCLAGLQGFLLVLCYYFTRIIQVILEGLRWNLAKTKGLIITLLSSVMIVLILAQLNGFELIGFLPTVEYAQTIPTTAKVWSLVASLIFHGFFIHGQTEEKSINRKAT